MKGKAEGKNPQKEDNQEELVDIGLIHIDENAPKEQRIAQFLEQIKNPYLCKCGNFIVESVFADTEETLNDKIKQYLRTVV